MTTSSSSNDIFLCSGSGGCGLVVVSTIYIKPKLLQCYIYEDKEEERESRWIVTTIAKGCYY
jgi:hypothetical protein